MTYQWRIANHHFSPLIPYETDEVTRLVIDSHSTHAFEPLKQMTVGQLREWLLSYETTPAMVSNVAAGLTPEMVAAVSKLMRNQELVLAARKARVVAKFRTTLGLAGHLATSLQPNHPTENAGITPCRGISKN